MKEPTESEIIIIGAGASGIMAARELSKEGKKVIILESKGIESEDGFIHYQKKISVILRKAVQSLLMAGQKS